MNISFTKKIKFIFLVWREAFRLPGYKKVLAHLLNPIDSTRYTEFAYLFLFFGDRLKGLNILDVSSPHINAYLLSRKNTVVKTNIDDSEARFIAESPNLRFLREDALKLTFPDESFDLVCSISVVEHIYEKYPDALREMFRVVKKGGYVYLTFPVSAAHKEEWLSYPMYPDQKKARNGFFFQYRFDKKDVEDLFVVDGEAKVVSSGIYWERNNGVYDRMMAAMRRNLGLAIFNLVRNAVFNLYAGFFLLENSPAEFSEGRSFGNMSVIIQKRDK